MRPGEVDLRGQSREQVTAAREILALLVAGEQVPVRLRDFMNHRIHNARRVRRMRDEMINAKVPKEDWAKEAQRRVEELLPLP